MPHLFIYDPTDTDQAQIATMRWERTSFQASNEAEFRSVLEGLAADGSSFEIITIKSHGSPGQIKFGESWIGDTWFSQRRGQFSSIAKRNALIRFEGCKTASGEIGWLFLEKAAGAFLLSGGGRVEGETTDSRNFLFAPILPFGLTFTVFGNTRTVTCSAAGGTMTRS